MPRAWDSSSPELSIHLTEQTAFQPGDTIIGTVARKSHIVAAEATVNITLRGRCKARFSVSNGNSRTTYRGRFDFFRGQPFVFTLYQGPVHIPPGDDQGASWPFAIAIPTHLDSSVAMAEGDATFIRPEDPLAHELPPSFFVGDSWGDKQGFVEYSLEAKFQDQKHGVLTAVKPFTMLPQLAGNFIDDHGLVKNRSWRWIPRSHALDPAKADAKLSFREKSQQFFGSSKVPALGIRLQLTTPSIIQIGHPRAIPFLVQAMIEEEHTSSSIQGVAPRVEVNKFRLTLHSHTTLIVPSTFSTRDEELSDKRMLVDFEHQKMARVRASSSASVQRPERPTAATVEENGKDNLSPPEYDQAHRRSSASDARPFEKDDNELPPDVDTLIVPLENAPEPLDLGRALNITAKKACDVQPSTTTFNVQIRHTLGWKIQYQCADQKATFEGEAHVTVI